jgi:hypothetical protein
LGDAIQFLRYVPVLKGRCERVTVQAPNGLHPVIAAIPGVDRAISRNEPVDDGTYDCEIECSNLLYAARATIETIPDPIQVRGAEVPPACLASIRNTGAGDLKTGIVWNAGDWNPVRSIPLDLLLSTLPKAGLALVSLQRACGQRPECISVPGNIINAESGAANLLATAAIIAELDLIITVDTMVAHLAGSMGKPVWTILPYAADWRWMLGRTSPWYPSMRLFRQSSPGNWAGALREVAAELDEVQLVKEPRTLMEPRR